MNDKRETVQACIDDLETYLTNRRVVEELEPPSAVQSSIVQMEEVALDSLAGAAHVLLDDEHQRVIVCTCARPVVCTVVGGMYPNVYAGYCDSCERRWSLEWGK